MEGPAVWLRIGKAVEELGPAFGRRFNAAWRRLVEPTLNHRKYPDRDEVRP